MTGAGTAFQCRAGHGRGGEGNVCAIAAEPRARSLGESASGNGSSTASPVLGRPQAAGKFLSVDGAKLWVKGVTYGTFRPDETGQEFHDREQVGRDFAAMAAVGINSVRTYTPPPTWFLDSAAEHGLRVLVGLPWEQHVAFLGDRAQTRSILERVGRFVELCSGHPAVLAYAVGNEIPAPIVRWHGRKRVESFIERLYWAAKSVDPEALVTYINYPSTEYLELPFLDLCAFNVYLETPQQLTAYLARLQNLAGDRPLVLAEVGLDSRRNGMFEQAASLSWQLACAFAAGCAGTFVFSWTDEWHRGGYDVDDWDFGVTDRQRTAKPALRIVEAAYTNVPFAEREWPRVSVVVCSHNGARTIRETCDALTRVDYPDMEVIVVDDGSTDGTGGIVSEYGFTVISTENQGLSAARNIGAAASTGEYVAYLDDDAFPDPHWLKYLVHTFESGGHAAVGGPNVSPPGGRLVANSVARSPGGPIHVLLDDTCAEHVPGCNLAVRRAVLESLGGFDRRFRAAGDDVDYCWRILGAHETIGYSPGAMVWHHRRDTVRGYLRQQRGYGRAEALLERKWPEKYNVVGHPTWKGRIYGPGDPRELGRRRWRIYYGRWGTGLFQRIYQPPPGIVASLPLVPEWWLILAALAALCGLAAMWTPLVFAIPVLLVALGATVAEAGRAAQRGWAGKRPPPRGLVLTAGLHLAQPVFRLVGRIGHGLRPWWRQKAVGLAAPVPRHRLIWSEEWASSCDRLRDVEDALLARSTAPILGGDFDRWDLEIRAGLFGGVRLLHTIEEHGAGRQLVRFRLTPRISGFAIALPSIFGIPAVLAAMSGAWGAAVVLAAATLMVLLIALREASVAMALALSTVHEAPGSEAADSVLLAQAQDATVS
jgi:GT2 family glycosyltransferase